MMQCSKHGYRPGSTLIDVAIGSAILSLLLIPALQLMGQSSRVVHRLSIEDALLFDAERILEEHKVSLCDPSRFAANDLVDDRAVTNPAVDDQRVRLESVHDSSVANGWLRSVSVTVYQDLNRNRRIDASEPQQSLRTQWCRP